MRFLQFINAHLSITLMLLGSISVSKLALPENAPSTLEIEASGAAAAVSGFVYKICVTSPSNLIIPLPSA